jgi:hypothetical protein
LESAMDKATESSVSLPELSFTKSTVETLAANGITPTGRFKSTRTVPFQSLTPSVDPASIRALIQSLPLLSIEISRTYKKPRYVETERSDDEGTLLYQERMA